MRKLTKKTIKKPTKKTTKTTSKKSKRNLDYPQCCSTAVHYSDRCLVDMGAYGDFALLSNSKAIKVFNFCPWCGKERAV